MAHSKNEEYEYWSKKADHLESSTNFVVGLATQQQLRSWLKEKVESSENVLEMGCGTGIFSECIAEKAQSLTVTDLSDEMLAQSAARLKKFDNVTVQKEDCYSTSFPDGEFDVVVMGNLIHIIERPEKVLGEANRVLRKSGRVILIDATSYGLTIWQKIGMAWRYFWAFGKPPAVNRSMVPDELSSLAEEAGFVVEVRELIGQVTKGICLVGRKRL